MRACSLARLVLVLDNAHVWCRRVVVTVPNYGPPLVIHSNPVHMTTHALSWHGWPEQSILFHASTVQIVLYKYSVAGTRAVSPLNVSVEQPPACSGESAVYISSTLIVALQLSGLRGLRAELPQSQAQVALLPAQSVSHRRSETSNLRVLGVTPQKIERFAYKS